MKSGLRGLLAAVAFSAGIASVPNVAVSQTVYKCAGPNGTTIYSQDPCGKDSKLIMGEEKKKKKSDDGVDDVAQDATTAAAPPPLVPKHEISNIQALSNGVDDSNCRRSAQNLYVAASTARIDQANRQIGNLNSRNYVNGYGQSYVGNAAIANQQVEQEIVSLRQLISSEEARNDQINADSARRVADALAECDRRKSEREKN